MFREARPGRRFAATLAVGVAMVGASVAGIGVIDRSARDAAYRDARAAASDEAAILAAGLEAELDKFSLVPLILADDSDVRGALARGARRSPPLNLRFEALARQTSAAAIYLMDASGTTLAASNWRLPTSFVGSNYSFRPYFRDALTSGSATQFALGTVSREPGLYIAQRVEAGGRPVGVVAVKVEFDRLEAAWRKAGASVFVSDPEGVVLITSREGWRFRTTRPEAEARRDPFRDKREFGVAQLSPLKIGSGGGDIATSQFDADQPVNFSGWRLHLLIDPAQEAEAAITRARLYTLLVLLAAAAAAAFALILKRRREARAQRLVDRKTQDLREQLGQANRLAILGQVTAGIGHEINQPVAAVQLFAESGAKLLEQGHVAEACTNFERIVEMVQRIGRITAELRSFARRGSADPENFPIGRAIDGALMLLHDRIERSGAALALPDRASLELAVRAEPVRLEQVLVNLLQNALDAIEPKGGRVTLAVNVDARFCYLRVVDDGQGLGGSAQQLFQPFATTKPAGLGLGLVISRDIMRGLGGELSPEIIEHGACFVMKVPLA